VLPGSRRANVEHPIEPRVVGAQLYQHDYRSLETLRRAPRPRRPRGDPIRRPKGAWPAWRWACHLTSSDPPQPRVGCLQGRWYSIVSAG
jgi:hypothetical protein